VLVKVVSGGPTGADQGALRAARAAGVPTGGWMPLEFLTEDGPRREFAGLYGVREMPTPDYWARTEQNVRDSEGTLWFGTSDTPGGRATITAKAAPEDLHRTARRVGLIGASGGGARSATG
jgi:hypothetical protein